MDIGKVLIVDGDINLCLNLRAILEPEGLEVTCAHDGKTALTLSKDTSFDLALVDITLPDGPGLDLIERLGDQSPTTEFVAITGHASLETAERAARQQRILSYEQKPLDIDRLLLLLREALRRRELQRALQASEERYRSLFQNMLTGFAYHKVVLDDEGRPTDYVFLEVNDAFERLTGLKRADILGRRVTEALPGIENDPADWIGVYGNLALGGEEVRFEQYAEPLKRWYSVLAYSPEREYFVALFHDITDRKQAEELLRRSGENARDYLESAPDGVYLNDTNGIFLYGNKEAERITGYAREELIGKSFLEAGLLPEEYWEKAAELLAANAAGESTGPDEFELIRRDGTRTWVEIRTTPIEREEGRIVIAFARDISERKRMEEQLRHSQLLASLGEMTAGIAHEVNNPLASIILFAGILMEGDIPEKYKKDLGVVLAEARRASRIMSDLLSYSRRVSPETQRLDLHEVVRKVMDMRAYRQKVGNITPTLNLVGGALPVEGDPSQLTQVFMNLVVNAEQALKGRDGGKIVVSSEVSTGHARISVADNGPGIPGDDLGHVFFPFFTTKAPGSGTGLGLSTCYGIVTGHGGLTWAENNEMGGATLVVELPLTETEAP